MYIDYKKFADNMLYPLSLYSRQIAGTLAILFIARYLPVYDYGLFSSYRTIAALGLLLANIGYNDYILVSSKNIVKEVRLKIGFFLINALFVILALTGISLVSGIEYKLLFFLTLIRTFFDSTFFLLILPYFQSSHNFRSISIINLLYSTGIVIITTISYIFKFSLLKFLLLSVCLGLFNLIQVSLYAKFNYILSITHFGKLFKKLDKSIFAYIGVLLCAYLYGQLPSLYVSTFVDKEAAALYFAGFTIAFVINLLLSAQTQKMIPEMIKANVEEVTKKIKLNLKIMMSINAAIIIFFLFFGKYLLKLIYSNEYYVQAYPILIILTIANISIALAAIYGTYITASGNQKLKIRMQIEAIIISVITLMLLNQYGIYAAAIAYLLSATHIGIRYVITTKKLLKNHSIN